MFWRKGRKGSRAENSDKCLNEYMIKAVINHLKMIIPGFPFMIDQYTRFNYNRSFWDILQESPSKAIEIIREYYTMREEYYLYIVYEMIRVLTSGNHNKIDEIIEAIKKKNYEYIDKILCIGGSSS